ncbi:MAG: hypothetical protein GX117_01995, partial [Candidatus Hydrogenedentes bacterium]|nr:hypothetical protein [Candidatus Hydrogenedentota bacterium]
MGRFGEALSILDEINSKYPNVKNVLYPMAFCCENLGYNERGLALCEQLIGEYSHEKAHAIKARIELAMASPEAQDSLPTTAAPAQNSEEAPEALVADDDRTILPPL